MLLSVPTRSNSRRGAHCREASSEIGLYGSKAPSNYTDTAGSRWSMTVWLKIPLLDLSTLTVLTVSSDDKVCA